MCAQSAVVHAMIGITAKEISALKGIDVGKIRIDMDQAGLYPASAVMCALDGRPIGDMALDGTLAKLAHYTDLDHGRLYETPMAFRSWAI